MLGWGEGTLSRFISGDIPSRTYSDTLRRILDDINGRNSSKIESAAKYLLIKLSEITPLALQKLLYYSQGFNKAFSNVFLFSEDCEAWVHGPVYRYVYDKYRSFGCDPITDREFSFENSDLSEHEIELLVTSLCISDAVAEKRLRE